MKLDAAPKITTSRSEADEVRTVTPALTPSRYDGERGKWDAVIVLTRPARSGGYSHRFMVGYVDPTGSCRREYQGPIVPGPYAYAYGLGTCIAADPRMGTAAEIAANGRLEVEVADGDLIRLGWDLFRVRYERDQWIKLDHAGVAA